MLKFKLNSKKIRLSGWVSMNSKRNNKNSWSLILKIITKCSKITSRTTRRSVMIRRASLKLNIMLRCCRWSKNSSNSWRKMLSNISRTWTKPKLKSLSLRMKENLFTRSMSSLIGQRCLIKVVSNKSLINWLLRTRSLTINLKISRLTKKNKSMILRDSMSVKKSYKRRRFLKLRKRIKTLSQSRLLFWWLMKPIELSGSKRSLT